LKKYLHISIKLIITGLILFLLFRRIDFEGKDFFRSFSQISLKYFFLSLTGVIIVIVLKAIRWAYIVKKEGFEFNKVDALLAYFSSYTIGIITPGRLGELSKVYNLREKSAIRFITGFITVVADRLFDMVFLIWIGIASLFHFLKTFDGLTVHLLFGISAIITWVSLIICKISLNILNKKVNHRFVGFLNSCLEIIISYKSFNAWIYTALAYFIFYWSLQILFLTLGIHIGFVDVIYVFSIVSLVLLLPISIAGFGPREASLVYLLGLYGISDEIAILYSFFQFLAFFVWGGLIGGIVLLFSPFPFRTMAQDVKKIKSYFKSEHTELANESKTTDSKSSEL